MLRRADGSLLFPGAGAPYRLELFAKDCLGVDHVSASSSAVGQAPVEELDRCTVTFELVGHLLQSVAFVWKFEVDHLTTSLAHAFDQGSRFTWMDQRIVGAVDDHERRRNPVEVINRRDSTHRS